MERLKRYWKRLVVGIVVIGILVVLFFINREDGVKRYRYLERDRVEYEVERYPVYVDVMFSGDERLEIRRGIERWNSVLNGYREMEVVSEGFSGDLEISRRAIEGEVYLILWIPSDSPLIVDMGGELTLGFVNEIGGTLLYLVPDNMEGLSGVGVKLYNVVLHEVGHLLGARHVEIGLMRSNYDIGSFICVDEGTARQVGSYYGYDWGRMNYCVED